MLEKKVKFYYNHKNRSINYVDLDGEVIEVKCNEKDDVDVYVGAALAIVKSCFGSTTKFMKFVDLHYKGKRPEDYEVTEEENAYMNRTEEEVIADEMKYSVGQRVRAFLPDKDRDVLGTIVDYDEATQEYVIEWHSTIYGDNTFRCRDNKIIRGCRAANKKKEI